MMTNGCNINEQRSRASHLVEFIDMFFFNADKN